MPGYAILQGHAYQLCQLSHCLRIWEGRGLRMEEGRVLALGLSITYSEVQMAFLHHNHGRLSIKSISLTCRCPRRPGRCLVQLVLLSLVGPQTQMPNPPKVV